MIIAYLLIINYNFQLTQVRTQSYDFMYIKPNCYNAVKMSANITTTYRTKTKQTN